jgi:hypothetical protein
MPKVMVVDDEDVLLEMIALLLYWSTLETWLMRVMASSFGNNDAIAVVHNHLGSGTVPVISTYSRRTS